jgi:lipopolysaccharide transport system permease protein
MGFIAAEGIIKQLPIPLFVHILRLLWRNMLIFFHNLIIFPLVLLAMREPPHWTMLISVLGFALLIINLSWLSLLLSLVCARYRDLAQIVASVLQVVFYLTPIVWMPKALPHRAGVFLLNFNPAFHLIEVVRAPLLGQLPTATNWIFAIALGTVGWCITLLMYGQYKRRIAYWL